MKVPNLNIETHKLTKVKPYWRNARDNDGTVSALKKSIEEFGFNQPLVVDSKMVLITGHARYRALKELGYKEAPCIVVDLDDEKAKAYRIADNKIHELTKWNEGDLILELRELGSGLMQDFFPEINLDDWLDSSLGLNVEAITDEAVEAKRVDLEDTFKQRDGSSSVYWEVVCPNCAHEFYMNVDEINRKS